VGQKATVEVVRVLDELYALCAPMHDYETFGGPSGAGRSHSARASNVRGLLPNNRGALEFQCYAGDHKAGTTRAQPRITERLGSKRALRRAAVVDVAI
jgi:hypothetical protein